MTSYPILYWVSSCTLMCIVGQLFGCSSKLRPLIIVTNRSKQISFRHWHLIACAESWHHWHHWQVTSIIHFLSFFYILSPIPNWWLQWVNPLHYGRGDRFTSPNPPLPQPLHWRTGCGNTGRYTGTPTVGSAWAHQAHSEGGSCKLLSFLSSEGSGRCMDSGAAIN